MVAVCLLGLLLPSAGLAQTTLPDMELRVTDVSGDPEVKPDTATEWRSVEVGRTLRPGDRLRTGEEETVELEVPSVSFFRVTEQSLIEVRELDRSTEERGLLTTEEVVVNNIKLSEIKGKVQNSVKKHEGVATEYELNTPNAVAGIRGTDFQCEVTTFGQTECAVLEGQVRFSSLENPDASVNLGPGQQSSIGADERKPSDPSGISEETRRELQAMKNKAQSALRLKPTLSSFEINGTGFQNSVEIAYTEQTTLTISGEATVQEPGAELSEIRATVDGEDREVGGLSEWSLPLEPEVPEPGERRTIEVTLRAVDSYGSQSSPKTLTLTLINKEKSAEGLPSGYESGDVEVRLASLAGRPAGKLEFPLHVYRPDASEGGLTLRGEAKGDAAVENVGYSLDGGKTWKRATGAEKWSIDLPAGEPGKYTVLVRAWTVDGILGEPIELGPINYRPISYEQAMREAFDGFWTSFEKQDAQRAVQFLHPDFLFEPPRNQQEGGDEFETQDRSGFKDFLKEEFGNFLNLRVFYSINTVFGNPQGGTLRADPIEWNFKAYFGPEKRYFPAATTDGASFKYRRIPSGQFRILSFQDYRPKFFIGFDNVTMGDSDGYRRGSNKSVITDNDLFLNETNVRGWLIAGFDIEDAAWPGDPAKFYININDGSHTWCPCGNANVTGGGIYKTPHNSFDDVETIPSDLGRYSSSVTMQEGVVYAVNLEVGGSQRISYLIQVQELQDVDGDPQYDKVRFRVINPGGGITTDYSGINPFS